VIRNLAPNLGTANLLATFNAFVPTIHQAIDAEEAAAAGPKQSSDGKAAEPLVRMEPNAILNADAFSEEAIVVVVFKARKESISIAGPLDQGEMQVLCPFTAIPISALPSDTTKLLDTVALWMVQGLPVAKKVAEGTVQEATGDGISNNGAVSADSTGGKSDTKDSSAVRVYSGGRRPGCSADMREAYIAECKHITVDVNLFRPYEGLANDVAIRNYIKAGIDLDHHSWDRINLGYNIWLRKLNKPDVSHKALPLLVVVVAQKEDEKPKGEMYGVFKRPRSEADVRKLKNARDAKDERAARRGAN
jgi:hypothetical protein